MKIKTLKYFFLTFMIILNIDSFAQIGINECRYMPSDYYDSLSKYIFDDESVKELLKNPNMVYTIRVSKDAYVSYIENKPEFTFEQFKNLNDLGIYDFTSKDSAIVNKIISEVPRLTCLTIPFYYKLPVMDSLRCLEIFVSSGKVFESSNNTFPELKLLKVHFLDSTATLSDNFFNDFKNVKNVILEGDSNQPLPLSIGNLKQLDYLDINIPNLSELPNEIGMLKQIKVLVIEDWNVSKLPDSFSNLKTLERFYIYSFGPCFQQFPFTLQSMNNLSELIILLDKSDFKNLPENVKGMTGLKQLVVRDNCSRDYKKIKKRNNRILKKMKYYLPNTKIALFK